jgi:hypothetical protein
VWSTAEILEQLARLDTVEGRPARAVRLFAAADEIRQSIGLLRSPSDRLDHENAVNAVRASLGEATFGATWAEGRAMTPEQAVAYALDEQPSA